MSSSFRAPDQKIRLGRIDALRSSHSGFLGRYVLRLSKPYPRTATRRRCDWEVGLGIVKETKREGEMFSKILTNAAANFAPLDTPVAIDRFLGHWKPNAIIIMENELWPNLIMAASGLLIPLALLNARMSKKSFKQWSSPILLPLVSLLLSKFSLIAPLTTLQGIHFQLLHAPPFVFHFAGDLKYVVNKFHVTSGTSESIGL